MKRALLILLLLFAIDSVSAQPGVGKTKVEIESYARSNGWILSQPRDNEDEFDYNGRTAMYFFRKIGGIEKCNVLIVMFSDKSDYMTEKLKLNITPTSTRMKISTIPNDITVYGNSVGGVDFYRGFNDKDKVIIRGVKRSS